MQSGRGGGLADALKQYGVLRSHSITQQAGIQIEEKKLHILEKRLDEEKQKVSPSPCLPPLPPRSRPQATGCFAQSMHLDDRLRSLKELIDEKSDMATHLDRDINSGNQMGVCLSMVKVSALAVPQLGSCASSGRACRLWAARHSQEEAEPLGAQPLPRVLEVAASKVVDFTAF